VETDAMAVIPQVLGLIGPKPVLLLEIFMEDKDVNLIPLLHATITSQVNTHLVAQLLTLLHNALHLVKMDIQLHTLLINILVNLHIVFHLMLLKSKLKL